MLPGPLPLSGGLPVPGGGLPPVEGPDAVGAGVPALVVLVEMEDDIPVRLGVVLIDTVVRAVPQENNVATPVPQTYLAQDGVLPELQTNGLLVRY